jgi:hypothetical protein
MRLEASKLPRKTLLLLAISCKISYGGLKETEANTFVAIEGY